MKDVDRREFLKITGSSVATAAGVSSLAMLMNMGESYRYQPLYQQSQKIVSMKGGGEEFLIRPPGARGEEDFLEKCIKCYMCVEACPLQAIKIAGREHGKAADTPHIITEITACDLCLGRDNMRCNNICPTDALEKISTKDKDEIHKVMKMGQEMNMGIAILDKRVCYAWTGVSACWACHEICPYRDKAITVGDKRAVHAVNAPNFHIEECVGCGLCVEVCPVPQKAVKMIYQGDEALKAVLAEEPGKPELETGEPNTSFSVEKTESRAISDLLDPDEVRRRQEKESDAGKPATEGKKKKEDDSWQPSEAVDVLKF